MNTFADDLTLRIKAQPAFDADVDTICSTAITRLLPSVENLRPGADADSIARVLKSASIFAQATAENDKAMAQELALYSIFASTDDSQKEAARDILLSLGNHPGVRQVNGNFSLKHRTFHSYAQNRILRTLNSIPYDGTDIPLTDFQLDLWGRITDGSRVAVSAPTSAGKSFVVMEYLCQEAIRHNRFTAVFIAPTRALLSEINSRIASRLAAHPDIRVSTIPTPDANSKPKQVFVLTQERLQVLLTVWAGSFDLIIVDEAQNIGEESRGIILQDCLEKSVQRNSATRFLFLAPAASGFQNIEIATGITGLEVSETDLSPVLQNRIIVEPQNGEPTRLKLKLLTNRRPIDIGIFQGKRGFASPETALAAVALELGGGGASLVYGPSASQTEKTADIIASGIDPFENRKLSDLSEFIVNHVHEKYSLATQVLKGVSTHYGKMPSLLREAIEESFRQGDLKYLVCTTTLFQGVNLPARNVFIDTPTRGRKGSGTVLDAAQLWNFAGRAGRLGKDVVGNVFLVGYDKWTDQVLSERSKFAITPSFKRTVISFQNEIEKCLAGESPGNPRKLPVASIRSAAGLMVSRAATGTLESFLKRTLKDIPDEIRKNLASKAILALSQLNLPADIIQNNWTIDPFGLSRLYARLKSLIVEGKFEEILPVNPQLEEPDPAKSYYNIFRRINNYILRVNSQPLNNLLTHTALSWMRGKPLPAIISARIAYVEKQRLEKQEKGGRTPRAINYNSEIRGVFDFVEDQLRFTYVQLGRAYIELLEHALADAGLEPRTKEIYNFPLALELGVSSVAGQVFIELGLSRITASTFERLIPDSNPTVETARKWLMGLKGTEFNLSSLIWDELRRKGLSSPTP